MQAINQYRSNYAGLHHLDVFTNILREIMIRNISPEWLYNKHVKDKIIHLKLFDKITFKEDESINTLKNRTYDDIGFTTLYTLIRMCSILNAPTQGWGRQPKNADVTISDDVERLRNMRSKIVDCIKEDMDFIEMNDYFSNILNISQRIDTYLCKLPDQGFTREVHKLQTHSTACFLK